MKEEVCPVCGGSGKIKKEVEGAGNMPYHDHWERCPKCRGNVEIKGGTTGHGLESIRRSQGL